jgi:ATP-dependent 26S proteasome regulatory subunit
MVRKQVTLERLEAQCDEHRERGRDLRGVAPREAAQHLLKAADLAERIAELEEHDRLAAKRRELAENLRLAAREEMADQAGDVETVGVGGDDDDSSATPSTTDAGATDGGSSRQTTSTDTDSKTDGDFEYFEAPPAAGFDDVGGMEELIENLRQEVIIPFEHSDMAAELGVGINNGLLMEGIPGVGKTHVARCLAGELGYRFAEVDSTMLGSQYVNEGGENVAALFDEAEAAAPCVLFLDELDDLASDRQGGPKKTNSERGMVTKLLRCMERIQGSDILVIGATNLVDDIDGAIRRSGRFDATYTVSPPDEEARREIFAVHLEDVKTADADLDHDQLVELTAGFSGADIEAAIAKAARAALQDAVRYNAPLLVTQSHLETAIDDTTPSTETWGDEATAAG